MSGQTTIVGGGIAGVATAWRLAVRGARGVTVLERDPAPGQRATGRNAGMVRTLIADPEVQRLALDARALFPEGVVRRTGGRILATGERLGALREAAERSRAAGREVREAGGTFDVPDDGVADIHALLNAFLSEAKALGVRVRTGTEALGIVVEDGRAAGVRTAEGVIRSDVVVNAAGAWAGDLGATTGAPRLPLASVRRHLFTTGPVPGVDPDHPFVWDDSAGYYYRPESGGWLLSACDETPHPPGDPAVDPAEEERLAAKLLRHAPALAEHPIRHRWACLRTFAPDRRFVVGWDARIAGLYWVAGLGGHGITTGAAVGDLAAREVLRGLT